MNLLIIQSILLFLTALLGFAFGGWPERAVSVVFLSMIAIDQLAHNIAVVERNLDFDFWHLGLEVALSAILLAIALRADRIWPLFVVSAQLIAVIANVLLVSGTGTQPLVWAVLIRVPTWTAIILTLFGILFHLQVQKKQQKLSD